MAPQIDFPVEPSPREVYEQVKDEPFPDVRRENQIGKLFAGTLLMDADVSQRAWDYQQQQLQPLRDIEVERALIEQERQEELLRAYESTAKPTLWETGAAMFLLENTAIAPMASINIPQMPPMEGYDPLAEDMDGYWAIADQIVKAVHPHQKAVMQQNYDFETEQRDIIARSPFAASLLTGIAAGITSPEMLALALYPPAGIARAGAGARFAYGVGVATTAQAVSEVILHDQQQQRTLEESAINMLASVMLDGALGGTFMAARYARTREYRQAEKEIREYFKSDGRVDLTDDFDLQSVGAMRVAEEDVSFQDWNPKTQPVRWALGNMAKFMSQLTPIGQGLSASSNKVRAATVNLAETNIKLTSDQTHVSAETLVKVDYRRAYATKLEVWDLEKKAQQQFGMTKEQFNENLDYAMRRGDQHENPIVQQAAQTIRKTYDDLWNLAAQQRVPGTFKEVLQPDGTMKAEPLDTPTAQSYQTRMYNREAIDKDYEGFRKSVGEGIEDTRLTHNLEVDNRMADFRAAQARDVTEAREAIPQHQELRKAKRAKIENADRAIKGNRQHIGRLKERDPTDPKIKELETRIRDIEKNKRALQKEVRQVDAQIKAAKQRVAEYQAKLKEIEAAKIAPYMEHELEAAVNSYYQGVMNLKMGDAHFDVQGPASILKHRVPVKDRYLEPYLEKNWDKLLDNHTRTLSPRARLAEKFGEFDGDFEMKRVINDIFEDYSMRIQDLKEAGKIKQANKLMRERGKQLDNIQFMRDMLLGRVFQQDPRSTAQSMGRSLLNFNSSRLLNGMMLSSIPELGKILAKHGMRNFNTALTKSLKNWRIHDLPKDEAMAIASSMYRAQGIRTAQMADLYDLTPTTQLEGATRKLAQMTNYWSGQQGFDSMFKSVIGSLAGDSFVKSIRKGDWAGLKRMGFTDQHIKVMQRESKIHSKEVAGLWEPRMDMWDLRLENDLGYRPNSLRDTYDALLVREADTLMVQPGIGDRPKFMTSMTGRIIFQFKTFIMGATNRTMIPMLQGSNIEMFRNLAYMNALAMAGYVAYETGVGREIDWSDTDNLINEAMNRGGYVGYATEIMQIYRRFAGTGVASRHQGRDDVGALLGPSFGTVGEFWKGFSMRRDAETGEMLTDVDSRARAIRKLLPFQNHFLIRQGLDQAEGAAARAFGGEGRAAEGF